MLAAAANFKDRGDRHNPAPRAIGHIHDRVVGRGCGKNVKEFYCRPAFNVSVDVPLARTDAAEKGAVYDNLARTISRY